MANHPNRSSRRRGIHPEPRYVYNGVDACICYLPRTTNENHVQTMWHSGYCATVADCLALIAAELARRGAEPPRQMRLGRWRAEPHTWHDIDYTPCQTGMLSVFIHQGVNQPRLAAEFEAGVDGVTRVDDRKG